MDKLQLLETLEDIEDGVNAARLTSIDNHDLMTVEDWNNAKAWIYDRLLDEIQTARAELTADMAAERRKRSETA